MNSFAASTSTGTGFDYSWQVATIPLPPVQTTTTTTVNEPPIPAITSIRPSLSELDLKSIDAFYEALDVNLEINTVARVERNLKQIETALGELQTDGGFVTSRGKAVEPVKPRAKNSYFVPPLTFTPPTGFLLTIVIPVYNEARTIEEVLDRVFALPIDKEVIVVDDCSMDGTARVLRSLLDRPGLKVIFKEKNEGKGAALRDGFAAAKGDVIVVQDADLEYDPRDIPRMLESMLLAGADVVYGSRYLTKSDDRSVLHRVGNQLLTQVSNLMTGLELTDMETCYKAFKRRVIQNMPLQQNRFGFEPEVTAKIARRNLKVREVPIRYAPRGYGEGKKIGIRDAISALYCIVRYAIAE